MNFEALRDVNICTFIIEEAVVAFASQVIGLGVTSGVLQDSCQCDYSVQEHVLPDLTQSNVDMALK